MGEMLYTWALGRTIPAVGEDPVFVIWRWLDCCNTSQKKGIQMQSRKQRSGTQLDSFFFGPYNPFTDYALHRGQFIDRLPGGLAQMRSDSFAVCENFDRMNQRVFCSLATILDNVHSQIRTQAAGSDDQYIRLIRGFRQGFWLGIWGLDKTVAVFDAKKTAFASSDADWWQDYSTEWVTERFLPWSIYIDEPDESNQSIGYFVGFEASGGKLRLCCQQMLKADDFDPFLHHEFDFRPGLTLGEIADGYAFANSVSEDLIQCYCRRWPGMDTEEAREQLTEAGRDVAKRVLPFLVAFLSEDFGRSAFVADVINKVCTDADVRLEQRRTHDLDADSVRTLIAGHEGKLFIVEPPSVRRTLC